MERAGRIEGFETRLFPWICIFIPLFFFNGIQSTCVRAASTAFRYQLGGFLEVVRRWRTRGSWTGDGNHDGGMYSTEGR